MNQAPGLPPPAGPIANAIPPVLQPHMPFPPPPPPPPPGVPQAHIQILHIPLPPPPANMGPNWIPPGPMPPRHRIWRGELNDDYPRPSVVDLMASVTCNKVLKTRGPCNRRAEARDDNYLPVCRSHRSWKILKGRCKAIDQGQLCNAILRYLPPFNELCAQHRDWDGLPSYLLQLPVELRMHIFKYVLPDKPINAWLDAPLREDRGRIAFALLLVNKQIHHETMDILYGSQPFIVSLGRENIVLCGGMYFHDKSEWPSIMIYNPPRPNRTGHVPPMLKHIRHMRVQITFLNPGFPAGRPQHYPTWEESIDVYDMRDSARALVYLLREATSLQSLSISFMVQNILPKTWPAGRLQEIITTIAEPLLDVRNIPKATISGVYQIKAQHRISLTQYFLDKIRERTEADEKLISSAQHPSYPELKNASNLVLEYRTNALKNPTVLIPVTQPLAGNPEFTAFCNDFKTNASSSAPLSAKPGYQAAVERFDAFREAYHTVESHFRTVLPRGKSWFLHRARVAREECDVKAIGKIREEFEVAIKHVVATERAATEIKERAAFAALKGFDEVVEKDGDAELGENVGEGRMFGYPL